MIKNTLNKFNLRTLAALTIATLSSSILFFATQNYIQSKEESQFMTDSNNIAFNLKNNINNYQETLIALRAFISSSDSLSEKEFAHFVANMGANKRYNAIQLIDYIEKVNDTDLNDFYKNLEKDYQVYDFDTSSSNKNDGEYNPEVSKKVNPNNYHFIVKYTDPQNNGINYPGKDITKNTRALSAIMNAIGTNDFFSSGKMYYVDKLPVMMFNLPVYKNNSLKNKEQLKEGYIGIVSIGVKLDHSLFESLNASSNYINFQVYDLGDRKTKNDEPILLYDSRLSNKKQGDWKQLFESSKDKNSQFEDEKDILLGQRMIRIKSFSNLPPPNIADMNLIYALVIAGFLLVFLVIHKWLTLSYDKDRAQTLADNMTIEFKKFALSDSLTGLPNRRAFIEVLNNLIAQKSQDKQKLYLLFIDLDGFKKINDTLGHQVGDMVLVEYSNRVTGLSKDIPLKIFRIGGDEFTIILEPDLYRDKIKTEDAIKKILSLTDESFIYRSEEYPLSQSIGIAVYPNDGSDAETLFKNSDLAMYAAKKRESASYYLYNNELSEQLLKRNKMENLLLGAIEKKELFLVFQPKVEYKEGLFYTVGAEVLLRWNNEQLGKVSPMDFIPLAEETGLMPKLGKWVLKETAKQLNEWNKKGLHVQVSINLSAKQFISQNLASVCMAILQQYDISPNQITVELTETAMMIEPKKTQKILNQLTNNGFNISVDDFGTGYSSLSYLKKFPVSEIKIDKSFISDVARESQDKIIVEGIIAMSKKMDVKIVAEGVETKEQINWLISKGCYLMQGFYFSKPLEKDEFIKFYKIHKKIQD
jgi:diguanylate cyclase (GGDEF)-like protein